MLQTFKGATRGAMAEIAEEMTIRKTSEIFLLFTLGSQFDHLIKQALDRLGIFLNSIPKLNYFGEKTPR